MQRGTCSWRLPSADAHLSVFWPLYIFNLFARKLGGLHDDIDINTKLFERLRVGKG